MLVFLIDEEKIGSMDSLEMQRGFSGSKEDMTGL
jgi:hypothetical protein